MGWKRWPIPMCRASAARASSQEGGGGGSGRAKPRSGHASPLRPDERPLMGVLLAVHAFLPVARLYERMIEAGHPLSQEQSVAERFACIREKNAEAAHVVLTHGKPTKMGRALLEEIRRWDAYYAAYR